MFLSSLLESKTLENILWSHSCVNTLESIKIYLQKSLSWFFSQESRSLMPHLKLRTKLTSHSSQHHLKFVTLINHWTVKKRSYWNICSSEDFLITSFQFFLEIKCLNIIWFKITLQLKICVKRSEKVWEFSAKEVW